MTPAEQEWTSWEKRNPGVAHPERVRAQHARMRRVSAEDWGQATAAFVSDKDMTLAEKARRARNTEWT
jgi:hypothetical protein